MARAASRPASKSQNQPAGLVSALPVMTRPSRSSQAAAPAAINNNSSAATYIPVEGPASSLTTKYKQDVRPTPNPAPNDSFNVRSAHAGLQSGRKALDTR